MFIPGLGPYPLDRSAVDLAVQTAECLEFRLSSPGGDYFTRTLHLELDFLSHINYKTHLLRSGPVAKFVHARPHRLVA